MRFYGISDIGLKREKNEDYIILPKEDEGIKLFILADGMGGANAGEKASCIAAKTVKDYIKNNFIKIERTKEELERIIREAMLEANHQVYELSKTNDELRGMGTTLITCLIYRGKIFIGHIGDSRVYRIRQNVFRQVTKDHSFVQELVKQGEISLEEAKVHPKKNMLMRAIGVEQNAKPDIITKCFIKGDIILICSDGLTNMIDDKYIFEIIEKNIYDVSVACKKLIEKANYNGGLDNTSVILIAN